MLPVPTTNPAPSVSMRALTTLSTNKRLTTIKNWTPLRMKTLEPDAKRPTRKSRPQQAKLPEYIGKYVVHDAEEATKFGWMEFMRQQRGRGYFYSLSEVEHLARRLLQQYKHRGAPVVLMT